jgi:hypothetical protein
MMLADLQRAMDAWPDVDATVGDVMRDRARFIGMSRTAVDRGVFFVIGHALFHPMALHSARRELLSFDSAIAAARESWRERWALASEAQRASIERLRIHPPSLFETLEDPYRVLTPLGTYTLSASAREIARASPHKRYADHRTLPPRTSRHALGAGCASGRSIFRPTARVQIGRGRICRLQSRCEQKG